MKNPDGCAAETDGGGRIAASADRDGGGEKVGPLGKHAPSAVATHGEADHVNATGIDRVLADGLVEQIEHGVERLVGDGFAFGVDGRDAPEGIGRALRDDHEAGEFGAPGRIGEQFRAVVDLFGVVGAALADAVEEKHQRVFFPRCDFFRLEEAVGNFVAGRQRVGGGGKFFERGLGKESGGQAEQGKQRGEEAHGEKRGFP